MIIMNNILLTVIISLIEHNKICFSGSSDLCHYGYPVNSQSLKDRHLGLLKEKDCILMLFLLIVLIVMLFIIDGIPLIKNKQRAELTVFFLLISLSCILVICKDTGLPVTLKSLNELFDDYGKKLFG